MGVALGDCSRIRMSPRFLICAGSYGEMMNTEDQAKCAQTVFSTSRSTWLTDARRPPTPARVSMERMSSSRMLMF